MENNRVKLIMETMEHGMAGGRPGYRASAKCHPESLRHREDHQRGGGLCEGHAGGGTAAYRKRNEESGIRNSNT